MEDREEWYADRAEKYDRVIHAEMNALKQAAEDVTGYTIFVTRPPCKVCSKHIAAWGIAEVVWTDSSERAVPDRWKNDVERAKETFMDCGVKITVIQK